EVTAQADVMRFLRRVTPRVHLLDGPHSAHVVKLLELLGDKDFELPSGGISGALVHKADVPDGYLKGLAERDVSAFLSECSRRLGAKDRQGAVRALSSVIEEYPARGDALRLVGYRLLDMKQS